MLHDIYFNCHSSGLTKGDTLNIGTIRVLTLLGLSILNMVLAWFGYTKLCKLSLIFMPHLVFLLARHWQDLLKKKVLLIIHNIFIGTAVIPQLLLNPQKEKIFYWSSLAYFFILVVSIDKIMILTGKGNYPIVERINTFYHFYKNRPGRTLSVHHIKHILFAKAGYKIRA